jgi:hypothetical protein
MPVSKDTGIFLMRYIQGEDRIQGILFPVSLDELIPEKMPGSCFANSTEHERKWR